VSVPPVTRELARFVAGYPATVSERAGREVGRAVLDLLGVMLVGSREPAARLMLDYAVSQGTVPSWGGVSASGAAASQGAPRDGATVIGAGVRLGPPLAALVNGTAGHALDYDDIGLAAGHVSTAIVPAALAVAETHDRTGDELVTALALGYEVTHRLTKVYGDNLAGPYAFGYHKPSVYSVFGACAAVARLLRLDATTTAQAFGIAASQAGGLRVNFGTMTKPMHAGNANRTGVEAALLARAGFTASSEALEGRYGWHEVVGRGDGALEAALGDGPLAIEEGMIYKAYPCCGANHYAIDGVLQLMAAHGLKHTDVDEITVAIHGPYLDDVLVYPWPRTGLEGKFSLAYNVAAALVDGTVTPATFADEHLPTLAPARDKVRVVGAADLDKATAVITVRTSDGRVLEHRHTTLRGSLKTPFSWPDLAAKFRANCAGVISDDASREVLRRVERLGGQPSVRPIIDPLRT
jgi:2-methylcitrate dehydratase PrpD